MKVLGSKESSANLVARPFFCGRNPSNVNLSHGKPEFTSAGTKAVAPGSVSTSILLRRHSLDTRNPGSEIAGVPASEIRAIFSPIYNYEIILVKIVCSLNL